MILVSHFIFLSTLCVKLWDIYHLNHRVNRRSIWLGIWSATWIFLVLSRNKCHLWKDFYDPKTGVWEVSAYLTCRPNWTSIFCWVKKIFLIYLYSVLSMQVEKSLILNPLHCGKGKGCCEMCISESFPGTEAQSCRSFKVSSKLVEEI